MIPPHLPIHLPGLHAYADALSVAAGESIGFHVSSTVPYRLSLCQLGRDIDNAASDKVLQSIVESNPVLQAIHPGSYVYVRAGLPAEQQFREFSVECWIRPWGFGELQTVLSQFNWPRDCGFGLFIDAQGRIECYWGDGQMYDPLHKLAGPVLSVQCWTHVVATFRNGSAEIWLNGEQVASGNAAPSMRAGTAALRLGACGVQGLADRFFEGDLVMPVIYQTCLDGAAIMDRFQCKGLQKANGTHVLGCWPLDEEQGATVGDASPHGRTGQLVNHGTWMITGPAFDASKVPRYSPTLYSYSPAEDKSRGHGLRLASDDLVDCRWTLTHTFDIPKHAASGLYLARFDFELDGQKMDYEVTFIVRRCEQAQPAPMLVLCSTNTWLAYSASPFARNTRGSQHWPRKSVGLPNSHPLAPSQCTYTFHRMGQPTYYTGLKMPRPNASPRAYYAPEDSDFSQWTRLERHLHLWLDRHGYAYDVVTDLDVHKNPDMLSQYKTVVINGHSEYWSAPAVEGLDSYLAGGGTAVVLSGNTMYWRVSFDEDGTVMEQRKTQTPHDSHAGANAEAVAPAGPHGEQYHSQDGKRGGLWRYNDRPCAEVIGLDTAGWGFAKGADFGIYRVQEPAHFLFHRPLSTGLEAGSTFGHAPNGGLPRAVGHEWDMTTRTLMSVTRHIPADALAPQVQESVHILATGVRHVPGELDAYLDYYEGQVESIDGLSCEMIYWQRPQGGRVFNAGAVGASWVLGVDDGMGRLLANVFSSFGIPYPQSGAYGITQSATPPTFAMPM